MTRQQKRQRPIIPQATPLIRCAIYTRKSSEEGLDQAFNSLQAQREACEAYILSQAHEGWETLTTHYDDGGFSGGTLERPGLERLLTDLDAGLIDLVLVYKVDRLSRSLADFARLIEQFDEKSISFVSVTQQFNTASSMGRLTLNVLLSFAQFEREVTSERIRDKIAASKMKGLWMGGICPLGYNVVDKQLQVNPKEAEQVNALYQQYLVFRCIRKLRSWSIDQKITSKRWVTANGKQKGGSTFSRGALYSILKNPLYIGKIHHQSELYDGKHQQILSEGLWQQVQDQLAHNRRKHSYRTEAKAPALLAGLLVDDKGNPMSPTHTKKGQRRYCYYVSQAKLQMRPEDTGSVINVSADTLEPSVIQTLIAFLTDTHQLLDHLPTETLYPEQQESVLSLAKQMAQTLQNGSINEKIELFSLLIDHIQISRTKLKVTVYHEGLLESLLSDDIDIRYLSIQQPIVLTKAIHLKRMGIESKLIVEDQPSSKPHTLSEDALGRGTLQAMKWLQDLITGKCDSLNTIAKQEDVNPRFIRQRLNLALLPPEILLRICDGEIPKGMTLEQLKICNSYQSTN